MFRHWPSNMGHKKNQNNVKPRIKTEKCQYYDSGYCKYGDKCNKIHPDKVCNDENCIGENCDKRHPNPCKFGVRCKHNKKKKCSYSHVTFASDDEKINDLEKKFEYLENKVREIENVLTERNERSNLKITNFEKKIQDMENKLEMYKFEDFKKKIKDLETVSKKQTKNTETMSEKVNKLETIENTKSKQIIKCPECDFSTTSTQGLKNHKTRKHKGTEHKDGDFPRTCDLCDT